MKLGHELATLTAGIDALYRDRQRSGGFLEREGLIPVAVAAVEPAPLRDYREATDRLHAFEARLPAEAESLLRQNYLAEMTDSLLALVEIFDGGCIPFAERLRRQLRIGTRIVDDAILDGYRASMRENLDEIGYRSGSLADDVRRWEDDTRVPADAVLSTLREFGEEARRRVNALMYDMGTEWLEPTGVQAMPFSAYCDYPGRKLIINTDLSYTSHQLKHLACHEAFPGHLVHLFLRERYVAEGLMPLDAAQVVTSSASSVLFEGIADNGIFFLDWVEGPADELGATLQRLRSALRCNATWLVKAEGKSNDEAAHFLADGGYQDIAEATNQLALSSLDLRAPFPYAYWCGDVAVHEVWAATPKEGRKEFWAYLYGNMHTPNTLRSFWG